eukprot:GEMP01032690.1.p1 GENE.GEMP01032690.1~~GEMP01032690.1.p1  ORF type:complete len:341 (+),score=66.82 GEMP01032690.1:193-1215(+)
MSMLARLRKFIIPEYMPLWLSFLGLTSWLLIFCGICLVLTKAEAVENITILRRCRRFLTRLHRRVWFFNRKGPFVRLTLYTLNVVTRWKLTGQAKRVPFVEAEPHSVSTATLLFDIPPRGWNILYVAEYDVLYCQDGTKDWKEIRNSKNEIRREKSDRTRRHEVKLSNLIAGTKYAIHVVTRTPSSSALSDVCYLQTLHTPNDEWGFHGDGFTWGQTKEEVNLKVELPEKTRGRQVSVKCNGQELSAEIVADSEGYPHAKKLVDGPLVDNVFPDSVIWNIDDGFLDINMSKRRVYGKWTSIFPDDPKVDPGLLKFFTDGDAHQVLLNGPENMPEGMKDYY